MKSAALEAGAREYVLKQEIATLPEIVSSLAGRIAEPRADGQADDVIPCAVVAKESRTGRLCLCPASTAP